MTASQIREKLSNFYFKFSRKQMVALSEIIADNSTDDSSNEVLLSDLTDVDISNPEDGQTLIYNASVGKWVSGSNEKSSYKSGIVLILDPITYDNFEDSGLLDKIMRYLNISANYQGLYKYFNVLEVSIEPTSETSFNISFTYLSSDSEIFSVGSSARIDDDGDDLVVVIGEIIFSELNTIYTDSETKEELANIIELIIDDSFSASLF